MFDECRAVKVMGFTTVEAWFGQDPDDFIEIVTGGAKYTTPQLGDVDPIIVEDPDDEEEDDDDEDEDAQQDDDELLSCYSPRRGGAIIDPWLLETGGGWCCDDFPALKECEGIVDYDTYLGVIENTYAESLRRRGICPPAAPPAAAPIAAP